MHEGELAATHASPKMCTKIYLVFLSTVQSCYSQFNNYTVPSAHVRGSMAALSDGNSQLQIYF